MGSTIETTPVETELTITEAETRGRILSLIASANRVPVITDDVVCGKAGDLVKMLATAGKKLDEIRDAMVRPLNEQVKATNASFKGIATQLDCARREVQRKRELYLMEKERAVLLASREAAAKAQEAALRDAEKAEKAGDHVSAELALEAAVVAPVAVKVTSRGDYGSTSSFRSTWSASVRDFSKLPDEFKLVDEGALRALASSRPAIPGVEWVENKTLVTR